LPSSLPLREETGWKLVHADVFRPPTERPMLLCVFVGTGAQLTTMAIVTIAFAAVGFLSPANRGSLMIAVLLTYVLCGAVAGKAATHLAHRCTTAFLMRVCKPTL
jgi:transmembrane 9 superfamily protein 2/4